MAPVTVPNAVPPVVAAPPDRDTVYENEFDELVRHCHDPQVHAPVDPHDLDPLKGQYVAARRPLNGGGNKTKRDRLKHETRIKVRSLLKPRPPTPGTQAWLETVIREGGSLAPRGTYETSYDTWAHSYGKSYSILDQHNQITGYVVHTHWAGPSPMKFYLVYCSIKSLANEHGPKTGNTTRQYLSQANLPLTAAESLEPAPFSK